MSEGNLLGHIIDRSGIKFDVEQVQMITKIPHLANKKVMWSSLGKTKFL